MRGEAASQRAQSSGSGSTSHSMRRRSCDSYETWSKSVQASFSTLIACASKLLKTRGSDVAFVLLPSPPPSPPLLPPPPPSAPHAHEARREVFACIRRGGAWSVSQHGCVCGRGAKGLHHTCDSAAGGGQRQNARQNVASHRASRQRRSACSSKPAQAVAHPSAAWASRGCVSRTSSSSSPSRSEMLWPRSGAALASTGSSSGHSWSAPSTCQVHDAQI